MGCVLDLEHQDGTTVLTQFCFDVFNDQHQDSLEISGVIVMLWAKHELTFHVPADPNQKQNSTRMNNIYSPSAHFGLKPSFYMHIRGFLFYLHFFMREHGHR